jgi:alkylation response protein AidB-like acyl-CoA dehydrogenase
MYSFEPDEEQQMLVDWVRRYATNDLYPAARDAEEECELPDSLIAKGWELGVLQASIPERYGGFGEYSAVTGVLAAEEMAAGDLAGALAVMTPALFALPILLAGSEEQRQAYLPAVIAGEWQPFTAALVEPQFHFDPNDLCTEALETENGYRLNGIKTFVPFAPQSETILVYARLGEQTQGFLVPGGAQGLAIGERSKTLGLNALPLHELRLEAVLVPHDARLGGEQGHDFERLLASARVGLAAMAVGLSKAAFEYARDYAKDREVFGVKVAQKQAIAFMLAEMATEIEAMRLLTWEAAWMLDQGSPDAAAQAYLAHTGATDMAMMVTDRAVQVLGGHGYIREHPVELWMRNGRGVSSLTGLAMV